MTREFLSIRHDLLRCLLRGHLDLPHPYEESPKAVADYFFAVATQLTEHVLRDVPDDDDEAAA